MAAPLFAPSQFYQIKPRRCHFFLDPGFGCGTMARDEVDLTEVCLMAENDRQIAALIEALQNLTVKGDQVAGSLAKLEGLLVEMLQKQEQDRAENKERMKKFDEGQEEFEKQQKKWQEQNEWLKNPEWFKNSWLQPWNVAYLFFSIGFAALAITVGILATR
jgi:ABC-type multidrug transport system fused ATPase/permease subunit